MKHISEIIEDILVEWAYRVHDGMPNPKNAQHIQELRESMEELNLPNKVIYEVTQNLINEKDIVKNKESGNTYVVQKHNPNTQDLIKKDASDDDIKKVERGDDKEDDTKKEFKVSKTLLQEPPEKETTSQMKKRRTKINEETDAIIKESGGDIRVVSNLIKKRRETLDNLWDKPAGGGGSLVGEMYGGISAEEIAHNPDLTEEEFVDSRLERLKGTPLYDELAAKAKATKPPTNPDKYVKGWLETAYKTGKSEIDYLKSEKKFKYKDPQTQPFPVGVTMDYNQRQTVQSTFEAKLENAKKNSDKEAIAHYEKQLRILEKLEDTDTGLLYETTDGRIGFKHTSNKKGWNAPHNNTSVRVKGTRIQKISDKVAQQNNLSPEQTVKMKTTLNDTIEEGANIVDKAEHVVDEHIKNVDTDEFVDNNFEAFKYVKPRRINYVEETRNEPSVQYKLKEMGIDSTKATEKDILRACVQLVKSGKAVGNIKKMVLKLSEVTKDVRTLKEKGLKKYGGPMTDEQIAKHLDIPIEVVKQMQSETNDPIEDTNRIRKDSMEIAHEKVVGGVLNADKQLSKETDEEYYPNPENAPNGPHAQSYVNSFMEEIHFTRYIDGNLEGVQSINIDGTNLTPEHFRNCLGKMSGFKGDPHTPEGKEALKTHLRKSMRVSPDGTSISFDTKGKDDKPLQVGQEVYRTKGASKSILAHLGKDIQSCLQKQSGAK